MRKFILVIVKFKDGTNDIFSYREDELEVALNDMKDMIGDMYIESTELVQVIEYKLVRSR